MIRVVHPWSRIPDPDADFLPIPDPGSQIPDPGVKKAPDPGSLPTSPHPLNTSSHKTAARRPPHPSYTQQHTTTLNNSSRVHVPVVFMAWYVMILRGATSLLRHWKGWALKISTFLGPNGTRFAHAISVPKKVSSFRAHPFQCPS